MSGFVRPPGIVVTIVCAPTGLLPGPDCPSPVRELFVAGTEPVAHEHYFTRAADGSLAIDPPAQAVAWAQDAGLRLATAQAPMSDAVRIVSPANGSVFWLSPELGTQQLVLRAVVAAEGADHLTFLIDGVPVAAASAANPSALWPLAAGAHTVSVSVALASGGSTTANATFEVRR
jgi:hypothetical protein